MASYERSKGNETQQQSGTGPDIVIPKMDVSRVKLDNSNVLRWLTGTFSQSFPYLEQSNSLSINFTHD